MNKILHESFFSKNLLSFYFVLLVTIMLFFVGIQRPILAPLIAITVLGLYIYSYYRQEKRFEQTYEWEEVIAKVLRKKLVTATCFLDTTRTQRYKKYYKISIDYKYNFNDNEYFADQYAMSYKRDPDCNYLYETEEEAKRVFYRSTADNKVKIYVNPQYPEESVIMKGKSKLYGFYYEFYVVYGMLFVIQLIYGVVH